MSSIIPAQGPPPLTQDAADAALDAIDCIAAVVRGDDELEAMDALQRHSQMTTSLQSYSTSMANSTITLMQAFNNR